MPLTYLDQNALIALGRKARETGFRKVLDEALQSGKLTIVLSTWHLIETAHTTNRANAVELAEFIDSLNPQWLFERMDVLKLDVEDDFLKFAKLSSPDRPRVTNRAAVFAALNRQPESNRFDIPARRFVEQWMEHPEQLKPLEKQYENNVDALIRLRELQKDGKITDEIRTRVNEYLVKNTMPKVTPSGLDIGRELPAEYLRQVQVNSLPTLAIETAISEHEWESTGGADRNTLIDKFHLITALPYVDEIVSDDKFFHRIYPVAQCTSCVRAKLFKVDDFMTRFTL